MISHEITQNVDKQVMSTLKIIASAFMEIDKGVYVVSHGAYVKSSCPFCMLGRGDTDGF